jgi:hypothetical protein
MSHVESLGGWFFVPRWGAKVNARWHTGLELTAQKRGLYPLGFPL